MPLPLCAELSQARAQGLDLEKGCTIYVERSGYIKKRQAGVPAWQVCSGCLPLALIILRLPACSN